MEIQGKRLEVEHSVPKKLRYPPLELHVSFFQNVYSGEFSFGATLTRRHDTSGSWCVFMLFVQGCVSMLSDHDVK